MSPQFVYTRVASQRPAVVNERAAADPRPQTSNMTKATQLIANKTRTVGKSGRIANAPAVEITRVATARTRIRFPRPISSETVAGVTCRSWFIGSSAPREEHPSPHAATRNRPCMRLDCTRVSRVIPRARRFGRDAELCGCALLGEPATLLNATHHRGLGVGFQCIDWFGLADEFIDDRHRLALMGVNQMT